MPKVLCMYCYTKGPQPCSRPPLPHTAAGDSWTLNGQVWISLFWDHCSFLLGPGVHKVLFVPFQNLFPQSYVSKFRWLCGGLMVTSSKKAYAIPRSIAPRAPAPAAIHY